MEFGAYHLLSKGIQGERLAVVRHHVLQELEGGGESVGEGVCPEGGLGDCVRSRAAQGLPLFRKSLPVARVREKARQASCVPFPLGPRAESSIVPIHLRFYRAVPRTERPVDRQEIYIGGKVMDVARLGISRTSLVFFRRGSTEVHNRRVEESFCVRVSIRGVVNGFQPMEV